MYYDRIVAEVGLDHRTILLQEQTSAPIIIENTLVIENYRRVRQTRVPRLGKSILVYR